MIQEGLTRVSADEGTPNADAPTRPSDNGKINWIPAGSWILYDLANTIYAGAITYVFVPYFKDQFTYYSAAGLAQTLTMVASGLMVPVMASICDRTGQTMLFLTSFTLICIGTMFGWAIWPSQVGLLIMLAVGNFAYQNSLVFYNSLLPSVSPPSRAGLISGLGVGIGYFGTILAIMVALSLVMLIQSQFNSLFAEWADFPPVDDLRKQVNFLTISIACAMLFLVLALPCLLIVRDRRHFERRPFSWGVVRERTNALWTTLREMPQHRTVLLFFIGNFFLVDVLNTAILYFAAFTKDIFFTKAEAGQLFLFGQQFTDSNTLAMIMGIVLCSLALVFGSFSGWLSDRVHPLRVVRASGWCLLIGLGGAILTGGGSAELYLLTLGGFGAFGLAGIWTAGRKVLLLIAPPEDIGQYFGLYGITLKLSVLGSTTFAVISDLVFEWQKTSMAEDLARANSQKFAIGCQLLQLLLGLGLLYALKIDDIRNDPPQIDPDLDL